MNGIGKGYGRQNGLRCRVVSTELDSPMGVGLGRSAFFTEIGIWIRGFGFDLQRVGAGVDDLLGEFHDAGGAGGFGEVEAEAAEHGPFETEVFGADIGEAELEQDAGSGPDGNQMRGATSFCNGGAVFTEDFLIDGMTCATEEEVGGLGTAIAEGDGEAFVEVLGDLGEFSGATGVGGVPGFFEAGADEGKEEV
jgi:hypothetical protein